MSQSPTSAQASRLPWPILAILSGVLLGLSQPIVVEPLGGSLPLDRSGLTGLLVLLGMIPAVVAIEGQGPKRAYAVGFVMWLVHFSIVIHWILYTLHIYGGLPVLVSVPILLLLTSAMAAYVATSFAISRVLARRFGWSSWWTLPVALTGVELLRDLGPLGGFPWGSIGHSFATVPVLLQGASLVGVSGLVFVAAIVNTALAACYIEWRLRKTTKAKGSVAPTDLQPTSSWLRPLVVAASLVVVFSAFGAWRLTLPEDAPTVRVGLLQPNVNEGLADLSREPKRAILDRFHALQERALEQGAEIVIWPEGSHPRPIPRDVKDLKSVEVVGPSGRVPPAAVIGAVGYARDSAAKKTIRHNSSFVVGPDLAVAGRFDKTHLVPFGEYVPWPFSGVVRQFIPLGTTTPGEDFEPITVSVGDRTLQVGSTICYEGVFPEISRELTKNGTDLLVNLTDDRWYGVSAMATQHLLMYALRAVESGLPVARSANTGISAWVDTRGRIHDATTIYQEAVVVADIPLQKRTTLFVTLGDWVAIPCVLFTLVAWLLSMLGGPSALRRHRTRLEWGFGVVGAIVLAGDALWYLSWRGSHDEALRTQTLLVAVWGLLVGIGALSGRHWGRRAILTVGILSMVFGAAGAALEAPVAGAALFVAGLLVIIGWSKLRHLPVLAPPGASTP